MAPKWTGRITLSLLLLVSVTAICEGLLCYECEYDGKEQNNPCYDPKKHSDKAPKGQCRDASICVKKKEVGPDNQPQFIRHCETPPEGVKDQCIPAGNPTRCFCSQDLCNTWPGSQMSLSGSSARKKLDPKAAFLLPALLCASVYYSY